MNLVAVPLVIVLGIAVVVVVGVNENDCAWGVVAVVNLFAVALSADVVAVVSSAVVVVSFDTAAADALFADTGAVRKKDQPMHPPHSVIFQ